MSHFVSRFCCALLSVLCLIAAPALGAEYFVALDGSDDHDGRSRQAAFATVQKGVDALEPGDTLTIAPGEYFGSVRREGIGGPDADTVIRAEIPGTAVLRGDVPAPAFRKVQGYRFVYVADFAGSVEVINELDTMSIIKTAPSIDELEFTAGRFHHDEQAGRLYLSTPDLGSPSSRRYTLSTTGTHGLYLGNAQRVIVEGIALTGFNAGGAIHRRDRTEGNAFGIAIIDGRNCVIRDCQVFLNGRGIAIRSDAETRGDNVMERCMAWANASGFGSDHGGGPSGGLTIFSGRRDVIRDSISFHNGRKGINIRGGSGARGQNEQDRSRMVGNIAWGNPGGDIKIKTGSRNVHVAERNVALYPTSTLNPSRNLLGQGASYRAGDAYTIVLEEEADLDPQREFADPYHHDFRLQATSRFRGAGPDGGDRGPFPYQPNIFYVSPDGDDTADGLSLSAAWQTLARATRELKPGDTLYLEPGVYAQALHLTTADSEADKPITIRGRGRNWQQVIIQGPVQIEQAARVELERLHLVGRVTVRDSRDVRFHNARFTGAGTSLDVYSTQNLRVTHSEFTGFDTAAISLHNSADAFLSGNIYDNADAPAVQTDSPDAIGYSDYNSYRQPDIARPAERYSQQITPDYDVTDTTVTLRNADAFLVGGPLGTAFGQYTPQQRYATDNTLRVSGPFVHSTSTTTANLEWWSSRPAVFRVHWGTTPAMEHSELLDSVNGYHPAMTLEHFNTFSVSGLKPGTQYYFQVEFVRFAPMNKMRGSSDARVVGLDGDPVVFTTASQDPSPRTLYVAVDGDNAHTGLSRSQAWRTISHAADQARPGDTVLVGQGVYHERVRIRTTGTENARITFKAHPGEKVVIDGAGRQTNGGLTAINGKHHLNFDGFYITDIARGSEHDLRAGAVLVFRSNHIRLTRLFSDGRTSGTHPALASVRLADDVLVKNCVSIGGWESIEVSRSTNVRVENNVFIRSSIRQIASAGIAEPEDFRVSCNIITDNLAVKRAQSLITGTSFLENNVFFLRWPEAERIVRDGVVGARGQGMMLTAYNKARGLEHNRENIVADPRFSIFQSAACQMDVSSDLFIDGMVRLISDFPDLFTTNPDLIRRGIGLEPQAFADFHFHGFTSK